MDLELDSTCLSSYTDAQIYDHIVSLSTLSDYRNITPLSSKYLAKSYHKDNVADAMRSVEFASQLGIRVPRIHRIIKVNESIFCIMDRIPGEPLDTLWPKLGWLASLQVAFKLRRFVCRLRSVTSASSGSHTTGTCRSYFLDDLFGLPSHASLHQVNAFLNFWANFVNFRQEIKKTQAEHSVCPKPIFSSNRPLVFTHHDLAPRNIILDNEGHLWLIDWDLAGFYPRCFEYAGMHNFQAAGWENSALRRWKLLTWIAGGFYHKEYKWLERIRFKSMRFRPARRFNMKANGYAAAADRSAEGID